MAIEASHAGGWPPSLGPGLYVHVPFCLSRCGYCDFYSETAVEEGRGRFLEGLRREAGRAAAREAWRDARFRTVYFGGGTPSLLGAEGMVSLLGTLRDRFSIEPEAEITAEANPESLTAEVRAAWRAAGIRRVSLGAQSMDDAELAGLGRRHDAALVRQRVRELRADGFSAVSLDLIYGLPDSTLDRWASTLEAALALAPDHLSAYLLTLEGNVPMERAVAAGTLFLPEDDLLRAQYDLLCTRAEAAGLRQYEISNFARPGFESRHNENYWIRGEYLGLGPSAHSHRGGRRFANPRSLTEWLARLEADLEPGDTLEEVRPGSILEEWIFLGLRRNEGVPWATLRAAAASERAWHRLRERAGALARAGLLVSTTDGLRLAAGARFVSNGVFSDLMAAVA